MLYVSLDLGLSKSHLHATVFLRYLVLKAWLVSTSTLTDLRAIRRPRYLWSYLLMHVTRVMDVDGLGVGPSFSLSGGGRVIPDLCSL
jgi:hypothetical protein